MRLDELFRNLGAIAATFGPQVCEGAFDGVPLEELDLTTPPPSHVALCGPVRVEIVDSEVFRVDVEQGPSGEAVRFALNEERLGVGGGDSGTLVKIALPAPKKLAVAGSGRLSAERIATDGRVSIAGSGRIEVCAVGGGRVKASIAGSGRLVLDGKADELELSIAGSGSCDAEGLTVGKASVHIAGSGDAIFTCNGEVQANLMGSGNVIVRGGARCSVRSMGSGTVTCEREREAAD